MTRWQCRGRAGYSREPAGCHSRVTLELDWTGLRSWFGGGLVAGRHFKSGVAKEVRQRFGRQVRRPAWTTGSGSEQESGAARASPFVRRETRTDRRADRGLATPQGVCRAPASFPGIIDILPGSQAMAIIVKNLDHPDEAFSDGDAGASGYTVVGDSMVFRSVLQPGWSWDEYVKPHTDGDESCPMVHREYVISGQIRYLTDEGDEVDGRPRRPPVDRARPSGMGGRGRAVRVHRLRDRRARRRGQRPGARFSRPAARRISSSYSGK